MKIALKIMICVCILMSMMSMVVGYFMFDYRASMLVLCSMLSMIGVFEGFRSLDIIKSDTEENDE